MISYLRTLPVLLLFNFQYKTITFLMLSLFFPLILHRQTDFWRLIFRGERLMRFSNLMHVSGKMQMSKRIIMHARPITHLAIASVEKLPMRPNFMDNFHLLHNF